MPLFKGVFLARILAACMPSLFLWPIASPAAPLENATIAVRQSVQCCYREGAMSYVLVRHIGSDQATTRVTRLLAPLEPTLIVGAELTPGRYVISSFQRPCDGNCDFLDAPVDQCRSDPVELRAGMTVNVLVMVIPFGGCSISIETHGA